MRHKSIAFSFSDKRKIKKCLIWGGKTYRIVIYVIYAPVAQLDSAPDSDSGGYRFDSCRVRQM